VVTPILEYRKDNKNAEGRQKGNRSKDKQVKRMPCPFSPKRQRHKEQQGYHLQVAMRIKEF
jgi:hypothetical protein